MKKQEKQPKRSFLDPIFRGFRDDFKEIAKINKEAEKLFNQNNNNNCPIVEFDEKYQIN